MPPDPETHEFDPVDPPPMTGHQPLTQYAQPPMYLGFVTAGQGAIAALLLIASLGMASDPALSSGRWVLVFLPAVLFGLAGAGLYWRRGWGWWLTACVWSYVFCSLPAALVLWTTRDRPFAATTELVVFGLAVLVLAALNQPDFVRFIRFRTPDGRPSRAARLTPLPMAFAAVLLRLAVEWAR